MHCGKAWVSSLSLSMQYKVQILQEIENVFRVDAYNTQMYYNL